MLLEALTMLEKEKNISRESILEGIENSLITACKNHFGKADNVVVDMNPETCEYHVYLEKTVVENVEDPVMEISLAEAKMRDSKYELDDIVREEVQSKNFGRIATQNAKNVILQKIREEERKVIYDQFQGKSRDVVTGIVQRYIGKNVSINLGKADALLTEKEMIKGEHFEPTQRVKVYILDVKATSKGPKILVSRTHPELVKRLFEEEVAEVRDGIVEIRSISREAGSRTKMAVWSKDPDVDAVGACVGMNGSRVNAIVDILNGEKIDIINWDDNAALLIQNALSPAKVISVIADSEEKTAKVIVPDYQLSLAIGKEGQNARLAARLTGFKIDIKSETQAREAGDFMDYETEYEDADYEDKYYEDYDGEYAEGEYADGYADGEYREGDYADSEYREGDYADGYADGGYLDGDYADSEYQEDDYAETEYRDNEYDDAYPDSSSADDYADDVYAGEENNE
ncbi:MAG: transcription termination factor NusA [Clostridiales bacterium]|nr:transcription termination factor NusA [Clostridiales bacterium]